MVSERARKVEVNNVCQTLSIYINLFQKNNGRYPRSLSELLSADIVDDRENMLIRKLIAFTQTNDWHDVYNYVPSTNGFSIIVIGPELALLGQVGKQRVYEQKYIDGEAVDINKITPQNQ